MSASALSRQDAKLLGWLEHDPGRFEKYLAAHPELADHIDALIERSYQLGTQARQVLSEAIEVPVGLAERIQAKALSGRDATDAASVVLDLLGVGFATMSVLFDDTAL